MPVDPIYKLRLRLSRRDMRDREYVWGHTRPKIWKQWIERVLSRHKLSRLSDQGWVVYFRFICLHFSKKKDLKKFMSEFRLAVQKMAQDEVEEFQQEFNWELL